MIEVLNRSRYEAKIEVQANLFLDIYVDVLVLQTWRYTLGLWRSVHERPTNLRGSHNTEINIQNELMGSAKVSPTLVACICPDSYLDVTGCSLSLRNRHVAA